MAHALAVASAAAFSFAALVAGPPPAGSRAYPGGDDRHPVRSRGQGALAAVSGRRNGRRRNREAGHPGGTGAVLGVRLLRYSGVQGTALAASNLIQLASIAVIANFL